MDPNAPTLMLEESTRVVALEREQFSMIESFTSIQSVDAREVQVQVVQKFIQLGDEEQVASVQDIMM